MALRCCNVRPHEARGDERDRAGATRPSCGPPAWRPLSRGTVLVAWHPRPWEHEAALGHLRARVLLARAPRLLSRDRAQKEPRSVGGQDRRQQVAGPPGGARPAGGRLLGPRRLGVPDVDEQMLGRRLRRFFRSIDDATAAPEEPMRGACAKLACP